MPGNTPPTTGVALSFPSGVGSPHKATDDFVVSSTVRRHLPPRCSRGARQRRLPPQPPARCRHVHPDPLGLREPRELHARAPDEPVRRRPRRRRRGGRRRTRAGHRRRARRWLLEVGLAAFSVAQLPPTTPPTLELMRLVREHESGSRSTSKAASALLEHDGFGADSMDVCSMSSPSFSYGCRSARLRAVSVERRGAVLTPAGRTREVLHGTRASPPPRRAQEGRGRHAPPGRKAAGVRRPAVLPSDARGTLARSTLEGPPRHASLAAAPASPGRPRPACTSGA